MLSYKSEAYLKLARIISKQGVKHPGKIRKLSLEELLKYIVYSVSATSAYVCQYQPDNSGAIVISEYLANRANMSEELSDLGEFYGPDDMGADMMHWIEVNSCLPRYIHIDELPPGGPEHEELTTYGGKSVAFFGIRNENEMLGFVEIWHSQHKTIYSADDVRFIQEIAVLILPLLTLTDPEIGTQ